MRRMTRKSSKKKPQSAAPKKIKVKLKTVQPASRSSARKSSFKRNLPPEAPSSWPPPRSRPETVSVPEAEVIQDLPFSYNETKLVLMVRDPYWAYSYWDFSGPTWQGVQKKLSDDASLKPLLRIHNLDQKRHYDLLISLEAKNWYIHLGIPDCRYVAELGIGDGHSRFYLIVRSNEVRTPRDTPSGEIDAEWGDQDFDEIYRLSGGGNTGLSSPGSLFFPRPL